MRNLHLHLCAVLMTATFCCLSPAPLRGAECRQLPEFASRDGRDSAACFASRGATDRATEPGSATASLRPREHAADPAPTASSPSTSGSHGDYSHCHRQPESAESPDEEQVYDLWTPDAVHFPTEDMETSTENRLMVGQSAPALDAGSHPPATTDTIAVAAAPPAHDYQGTQSTSAALATEKADVIHVRARFLHTQLGSFLQRDPLGYQNGPSCYEYLSSTPIASLDPNGTDRYVGTLGGTLPGHPYLAVDTWELDISIKTRCPCWKKTGVRRYDFSLNTNPWLAVFNGAGALTWSAAGEVNSRPWVAGGVTIPSIPEADILLKDKLDMMQADPPNYHALFHNSAVWVEQWVFYGIDQTKGKKKLYPICPTWPAGKPPRPSPGPSTAPTTTPTTPNPPPNPMYGPVPNPF
jgi:RHS repeat-associated protein